MYSIYGIASVKLENMLCFGQNKSLYLCIFIEYSKISNLLCENIP